MRSLLAGLGAAAVTFVVTAIVSAVLDLYLPCADVVVTTSP